MAKCIALPSHLTLSKNPETGKDEYYCIPCKKVFRSRTQKYYHYNCNNNNEKKHKCEHCQQSFSTRCHLNYHLEKHQNATYECTDCKRIFSNRLVFEKHRKIHKQRILFDCQSCQKQFRSKETLIAHKARHENELKFQCSACDKKYATKSALEQHKLKHSAKKHKCPHCGRFFQRNSILNVHLKRHNLNEFFVCTSCFKKFSDAGALQRHSKIHRSQGVCLYSCKECCITTSRKDNIQRHVRNMHIGESFDDCIEILKPTQQLLTDSHEKNVVLPIKPTVESTEQQLPQTVANSSVIKFVGKVDPVVIPHVTTVDENETEARTFTLLETVKSIDGHKKYDPIEMYRKILSTDESDEPSEHTNEEIVDQSEPVLAKSSSNPNFNAIHWRKKYTQHQGY